jgi:hypothetical protein
MAAWDVDYMKGITPHPVPPPQGEGTPELTSERATPSPLPGGEGQGEGRFARNLARPRNVYLVREV